MKPNESTVKLISKWRFRWNRGIQWTTIPMTFFSVVSMAIIWTPLLNQWGIPLWMFMLVMSTGFFFGTIGVGYIDDVYKFIKKEQEHFNEESNPYDAPLKKVFSESEQTTNNIRELIAEVREMKELLNDHILSGRHN